MYVMNYEQVGANILKELETKSITQQNLADALSVSTQVMSKIIKGRKAINVNELTRIATVLGTTVEALLSLDVSDNSLESMAFMEAVPDESTREKVELIRSVIDEIQLLEELI